jgi:hypothetical protein
MDPNRWLIQKAPGFGELSEQEKATIMYFSLLWSFFEAKALGCNASTSRIKKFVNERSDQNKLKCDNFAESLAYFKKRYFNGSEFTYLFEGLNLRKNDDPDLVKAVLSGAKTGKADSVAALLIIVYRLRNNLFHGEKWTYGIRDQLSNFATANNALMKALETI